jgi:very-short-patch-repair endonuclease
MKPNFGTKILSDVKRRGYVEVNNVFYPPNSREAIEFLQNSTVASATSRKCLKSPNLKPPKTGWIDDPRNLKNKTGKTDIFMKLVSQELGLEIWPEFYFLVTRQFRMDYAIPVDAAGVPVKICIEQDGGIHMKGGGAHSRPENIERDIEKSTLASCDGWTIIRRQPDQLLTTETLNLIQQALETKNK